MAKDIPGRVPITRAGATLAGLDVLAYLGGWWFGWVELMVLSAACSSALLLAIPFVVGKQRLVIDRQLRPDRVTVGEPAEVVLTISNPSRTPSGAHLLEDHLGEVPLTLDVRGMMPGSSIEFIHPLPTERRGVIDVGPALVAKVDPLGLMRREVRQAGVDQLWVRPRVAPVMLVPAGFTRDLEGPTSDTSPAGDVAFHALREYEMGDDFRQVHWLSTARTGSLMVRHHVDNRLPQLTVVLDDDASQHDRDTFDTAVEVTASLAISTMRARQSVALRVGGQAILSSRVGASVEDVLDRLTPTTPATQTVSGLGSVVTTTLADEPHTSVLVLVTGARSPDELLPLLQRVDRHIQTIAIRVWSPTDAIEPTALPDATVLDVATLDQFQTVWNRGMRR